MKLDFKAIFDEYNVANQKTWGHDRKLTVGASEVFGCIRQAWFKKLGEENGFLPDPDHVSGWGATSRGDIIEQYHAVPALKGHLPADIRILGAGKRQQTLVVGKNSATPDGVLTGLAKDALANYGVEDIEGDCILTEFKSVDPRITLRKPKDIHVGQVQQQMGIIREKTPLRPMYAVIMYFNASFLDDMTIFAVRFDEGMWKNAKTRANLVYSTTNPAKLPAEGKLENACEYCAFKVACASVMKGSHPLHGSKSPKPEVMKEIERLAIIRQDAQDKKNAAEREEALATEDLKEYLRVNNVKGGKSDTVSVSYSFSEGRKGLDKKALEEDGVDLSKYETTGLPFETIRVKFN